MSALRDENIFEYIGGIAEVLDDCPDYFEAGGVYAGRDGAVILAQQLGGVLSEAKIGKQSIDIAKYTYQAWFRRYYTTSFLTKKEWVTIVLRQVLIGGVLDENSPVTQV